MVPNHVRSDQWNSLVLLRDLLVAPGEIAWGHWNSIGFTTFRGQFCYILFTETSGIFTFQPHEAMDVPPPS